MTHVERNGDVEGYPGCVNLSFAFVEGESLIMDLKDIALSSGSACTSASLEPSYVLRALGASEDMAHSSLRFGIGRFTTEQEIDFVISKIVGAVTRLRDMRCVFLACFLFSRLPELSKLTPWCSFSRLPSPARFGSFTTKAWTCRPSTGASSKPFENSGSCGVRSCWYFSFFSGVCSRGVPCPLSFLLTSLAHDFSDVG